MGSCLSADACVRDALMRDENDGRTKMTGGAQKSFCCGVV